MAKSENKTPPEKTHRSIFKWPLRILKYISLLLLLLLICAVIGAGWVTQTQSGQDWLAKTANSFLKNMDGLSFQLTGLSGSIPADFTFSIEGHDKNGLWLKASSNRFIWDWRKLPSTLQLALVEAPAVDLIRLPDVAQDSPKEPDKPSEPFTIQKFQQYLALATDFLNKKHWWLPNVQLDKIAVSALLPSDLVPSEKDGQRIHATADLKASVMENKTRLSAQTTIANSQDIPLSLPSIELDKIVLSADAAVDPFPEGMKASVDLRTQLDNPSLTIQDIPHDFISSSPTLTLRAEADARTNPQSLTLKLIGPGLDAGQLQMDAKGSWQTAWPDNRMAGPLDYALDFALLPITAQNSPLAAIHAPVHLSLRVNGNFPNLNLNLGMTCAQIAEAGHTIRDTALTLKATSLEIPIDNISLAALEKENHLDMAFTSHVDQYPVNVDSQIFLQALPPSSSGCWRVGIRDLLIQALGIQGTGNMAAILPQHKNPAIDGSVDIHLKDWTAMNNLLPDQKLSGNVQINIQMDSGLPEDTANPRMALPRSPILPISQNGHVKLSIPSLALKSKDSVVEMKNMDLQAAVANLFTNLSFRSQLNIQNLAAAGLKLSAQANANGSIKGPIQADLVTKGSIATKLAAQWEPGKVKLGTLDVLTDLNQFLGKKTGKKLWAGIKSSQAAEITYGDHGLQIRNLDLKMLPTGHLAANGGLAPDKLDLLLRLDDFDLKPWQALSAAIPAGRISLNADMRGTPQRPGGQFKLNVNQLAIPNTPLKPMNIVLAGILEHGNTGSALKTRLELDQQTVKTLGGNIARIDASLPLLFNKDGIPAPNMQGPLAAHIQWDGALGPIWNLVPVADQRLNGRIGIDIAAKGTLQSPHISGKAGISQARYENVALGVLLTDINVQTVFRDNGKAEKGPLGNIPGSLNLTASVSDGRGGKVTSTGHLQLNGSNIDIATRINRLKPLRRRDVHVELSGHADVKGTALAPLVSGEIIVDKGEVLLNNISMGGSVTTLPITDPSAQPAKASPATPGPVAVAAKPEEGNLNLRITMQPRFSVEGRGLGSIWKANLLVTGPFSDPRISGNVTSVRGNFDFLGKNFALTKGIVFFGGGAVSNPLVDIDLTYDTPDLVAHIIVSGPVDKLNIKLTSEPSIPRDEIISRVLFGRSVNELSRMEALQLAGAVAQLAGFGGGPLTGVKKALGVDVLRVGTSNTGDTGDDNAGGTNIEMGKYINDFIYMGVQQGFKPDSTAFIIDVELTPRANIELRTEQNNTWAGFKWKYNY